MRRFLYAIVALLLVTASPAFAGYIIIRVLLEGGTGGAPAVAGGPSSLGPGPGMSAAGGRPSGPTGPPGGGGRPGGLGGTLPTPMAGGGPGMATGQPTTTAPAATMDHTRAVVILVPLDTDFPHGRLDATRPLNEQTNPDYRKLVAPYHGRRLTAPLFIDSTTIQLYQELIGQPAVRQTLATQMRDRYAAWARGKTDGQLLYDAFEMALAAGIIRERTLNKDGTQPKDAMSLAQELLDVAAEKKVTLPAAAQKFVTAWGQMAAAVKMPAPQAGPGEEWRVKLDAQNVRTEGHYSIVYWDSPEDEVRRRSAQLNDHFMAFFLVHATRGTVLPVPARPFTVVLAQQGTSYIKLRPALDGLPAQTNAFYSPEHDLLVLSPELMDPVGLTFQTQNKRYFAGGLSREPLLSGQIPKIDANGANGGLRPDDVARASTLAFVEKFVVEDSEIASVSREGTRQLLFATGGLPQHVTLPNWLTQGALNVYTRPHGPAYVYKGEDEKPYMTVCFGTGYGVPNYVNQRYFRDLDEKKELNPDPVKLLEHVLTDAYFTGLKDAIDPDPAPPVRKKVAIAGTTPNPTGAGVGPMPGTSSSGGKPGGVGGPSGPVGTGIGGPMGIGLGPMGGSTTVMIEEDDDPVVLQRKKRDRLNIKAQATAWALYHFLDRAKPEQLRQYIAELKKLPIDLPVDGRTSYVAFVRAFGLSGSADGVADQAKMRQFAQEWVAYMKIVPSTYHDIPLVVPAPVAPGTGGGAPMSPMGLRPGGGGPDAGGGPGGTGK